MSLVLLAEHDADRSRYLSHTLVACGYRLIVAETESEARHALCTIRRKLDAFVIDAALPGARAVQLAAITQRSGLLSLVIYVEGTGARGRRIKASIPGGLIYRGALFGIGPLLTDLRQATSGNAPQSLAGG